MPGAEVTSVYAFKILKIQGVGEQKDALFFGCDCHGKNIFRIYDSTVVDTWPTAKGNFYVTREGDSVKTIASSFGISQRHIIQNNNYGRTLKNSDFFKKGKILNVY